MSNRRRKGPSQSVADTPDLSAGHSPNPFIALACGFGILIALPGATRPVPEERGLFVVHRRPDGAASFVTGIGGSAIPVSAAPGQTRVAPQDVLGEHGRLFGVRAPDQQLRRARVRTDALGHTHTTFEQVHRGVHVFTGRLDVHQDARGDVRVVNGDFHIIPQEFGVTPALTRDNAAALAVKELMEIFGRPLQPVVERTALVIVDPGWYGDPMIGPHLAYHVVLREPTLSVREAFFVDAHAGELLDRWSLRCSARFRIIYDANGTSAIPGTLVRVEGGQPWGVEEADAAYDYLGDSYDYFWRAFGRDSVDDDGLPVVATVRLAGVTCPNAWWGDGQVVFCKESLSDDIAGHELMHGVTEHTAGLIYQNQPGQLNESFSDAFGELIDLFNGDAAFAGPPGGPAWPPHVTGPGVDTPNHLRGDHCGDSTRWMLGEDARSFGGAIRDMWDPTCFDDPDRANSVLQTCPVNDNGGVHSGSGIPNHAFAMLVDGKSFNGRSVAPVGPIKAGAIWYRALTTYLTPASDFEDAYYALVQAANDLVGTYPNDPRTGLPSTRAITPQDVQEVRSALLAVEMDTPGSCGAGSRVLIPGEAFHCPGRQTVFHDDFEDGPGGWTVDNSGPPTPYDWRRTAAGLPFARPGVAWHIEDRDIGDCVLRIESAVHALQSPLIALPDGVGDLRLSFTHFMRIEGSRDGGNVKARINGGDWQLLPREVFERNPYNGRLVAEPDDDDPNPLAGEPAWTGFGGQWGTSIADLSGLAQGGDTIELRFEFGKNGCGGVTGWYVDDVEIYDCPDCDADGEPDVDSYRFTFTLPFMEFPVAEPVFIVMPTPPRAASDVTLSFSGVGDLFGFLEFVRVRLNFRQIGNAFQEGGAFCSQTPVRDELILDAAIYNELIDVIPDHSAHFELFATNRIDLSACDDSYFGMSVSYRVLDTPRAESEPQAKNRYLSLFPGNPRRPTALQVTLADLPPPFDGHNGEIRWVGPPLKVSELSGLADATPPVFTAARLQCEPVVMNWGQVGLLHVFGNAVVPDATYEIRAVDEACGVLVEGSATPPLVVKTGPYGDIVAPFAMPGVVQPDIFDAVAVIDKFRNLPGAAVTARTDLYPGTPDGRVEIYDAVQVINAFTGAAYPFSGPMPCR